MSGIRGVSRVMIVKRREEVSGEKNDFLEGEESLFNNFLYGRIKLGVCECESAKN